MPPLKTHWFNPENDLALACNAPSFTPPKAVSRFKTALELLPVFYAAPGDSILVDEVTEEKAAFAARYGMTLNTPGEASPWGWSKAALNAMKQRGLTGPWPDTEHLRLLSHRRTALCLYDAVLDCGLPYQLPPRPMEITDIDRLPLGAYLLKSPWSCSGRGVAPLSEKFALDVIAAQGSVMVEPLLHKVQDFALLFGINDGSVTFHGISLFVTAGNGSKYCGNLCASQQELRDRLSAPWLDETIAAIIAVLPEVLPRYNGPCGIDMLTYRDDAGQLLICPTVEINLRYTMGFVAMGVYRHFGRGILRTLPGIHSSILPYSPFFSLNYKPL